MSLYFFTHLCFCLINYNTYYEFSDFCFCVSCYSFIYLLKLNILGDFTKMNTESEKLLSFYVFSLMLNLLSFYGLYSKHFMCIIVLLWVLV